MLIDLPYEITALPYYSESWLSREGAALKRRRIEKQGLPNFKNWRFVTLSYAGRDLPPGLVYLIMCDRMRRFLSEIREAIGNFRWCWKLEIHEDGYPHYHVLIEYKKKLDEYAMDYFARAWGLGRVNVKRVAARDIAYVFKYATKSLELVPAWVMDSPKTIRFFQTSRGFYTSPRTRQQRKEGPKKFSLLPFSHRRRINDDARRCLVRSVSRTGTKYQTVKLSVNFYEWRKLVTQKSISFRKLALCGAGILLSHEEISALVYENRKHRGLSCIPYHLAA